MLKFFQNATLVLLSIALVVINRPAEAIGVYIANSCEYAVNAAVTFYSTETSVCEYVAPCRDVGQCTRGMPACINYWYDVEPGETLKVLSNQDNTCLYFTAYMQQDTSFRWPTEPNCGDDCKYDLKTYKLCDGGADCYNWYTEVSM